MNDFDNKVMKEYVTPRFDFWKQHLTPTEISIFTLYYFDNFPIYRIAQITNYSEVQTKRILKAARKKIYKLLP